VSTTDCAVGGPEIAAVGKKISTHRHTHTETCDTRHPDWLSHASLHARGATKN